MITACRKLLPWLPCVYIVYHIFPAYHLTLRMWSPPERARIVPVPNKWEQPTGDVNAVLWVFMFRLQCIRSQTFLVKTLPRKQNKRRRFRLLCLSRFPVMAVTTQHGYHYGHGFNYPVTSTSISEDFSSVPPIKRNEVLPLKKRKASMLSKHDVQMSRDVHKQMPPTASKINQFWFFASFSNSLSWSFVR